MTIPGVGPVVSLASVVTIDIPARFRTFKGCCQTDANPSRSRQNRRLPFSTDRVGFCSAGRAFHGGLDTEGIPRRRHDDRLSCKETLAAEKSPSFNLSKNMAESTEAMKTIPLGPHDCATLLSVGYAVDLQFAVEA